ncbi:TPA: helix-turn-helix transcriptional regulator [Clostridium botulinum]|nr:helix-turn-helix transcriptional regulator [Clostridium botulinum]
MNHELLTLKRKKTGYTQQQMAVLLGYKDKSSYCLIENGKAPISLENAKKIKQILQLNDNDFNQIFFADEVEETQTYKVI